MKTFEIECGEHRDRVDADTLGAAWRKLVGNRKSGFAPLARWKEICGTRTVWRYQTPQSLDQLR